VTEAITASSRAFWLDRTTLVTGATGLVGGWLVKRLQALEANVVTLVRDWVPQSELVRSGAIGGVTVVRGDVRHQATLERVLGEHEVDTVIHLAAQTIVGIANRNPVSTFDSNIRGTWALLEACRRSPSVRQIVFASSDKAYGESKTLPYDEETALKGLHPYDVSKSCADLIAQTYANTYGTPVVITRCGNFYGGGDLNWNRIVPGTIRSAVRGERPVIRSDGTPERDYIYADDAVEAYLTVAASLDRPELRGRAWNAGAGRPVPVLEMVRRMIAASGRDVEPVIAGTGALHGEIDRQYLDSTLIREELGWAPRWDLDSGLSETYRWYERHLR